MRYPRHETSAPVSLLREHLAEAERLAAARAEPESDSEHAVGGDFEALRWFELPAACLP
jgi:hypothetical protein